ncbi:MAG TPA: alpha/beta hydrolase [Chloroflexota bacterium]|jgi:pimeloyl-ACP methyl ester carboxylesterase
MAGLLRERRFDAGALEINYAEGPPTGPAFVLLHGGSTRWQYGTAFLEALAERWHVYAPDLRGHGASGHVPGRYSLRDYAADTAAFLAGVVGQPAVVYGHSLGGEIAVMVAAERGALVRAIIVGDAPLTIESHATEEPEHRAQNVLWHRLAGRPADEIDAALREMPVRPPGAAEARPAAEVFGQDSPWFAFHAVSLARLDPDMLAAVLAGPRVMLAGYDPERLLPAIAAPVLLLQGDPAAGGTLRDDEVAMALRLLPRGAHVRLSGIGHTLHALPGHDREVLRAIEPFLASLAAT